MGKVATSPLPPRGTQPLQSGGQNQKWHTTGQGGYTTHAARGIPTASQRGAKSEVAHRWARWLHHPCRLGGSPPLHSEGQNQKWHTTGQGGYITHAAWGIPTASERGAKSEVAHKWARWLHHPCRLGGSPPLQSGGQHQKWPTSGQGGYITPAASGDSHRFRAGGRIRSGPQVGTVATSPLPPRGIPTASEGGAKSEVAHNWARWLHNHCRPGDPHRFRAGGEIRSGPQVGTVATSPLPPRGIPTASERGAKPEVAHKWARRLHNPCRPGDPHRFTAGGKIRSGPQVGKVATSPLPPRGIPTASERGAKSEVAHKWARWLHNPAASGIPIASEGGAKSEVAHKWARWLHNPAASGIPIASERGGKIRSGPQVGKVAT